MAHYDKKRRTWRAEIKLGGKRYRKRGFISKKNAELYEYQLCYKYERGILDLPTQEDEILIEMIFEKYLEHSKGYHREGYYNNNRYCLLTTWRTFLDKNHIRYISKLSKDTVDKFLEWRQSTPSANGDLPTQRTLNLDMGTLMRCFKWAESKGIIQNNPIKDVPLFKEKRHGLPRYLTKEEIEIIEQAAKEHKQATCFYEIFCILVRTGLRSGELCRLEIDNLDFTNKQIILRPEQTKAGRMRSVPIPDEILEMMQELVVKAKEAERKYLVYTGTGGQQTTRHINRRFRSLLTNLEKAGKIKNSREIHTHSLRRTYISHLIMAGVEAPKVMAIVGHQEWATIRRYLVLSPTYIQGARNALPY